jgi:hypothetical protein
MKILIFHLWWLFLGVCFCLFGYKEVYVGKVIGLFVGNGWKKAVAFHLIIVRIG